MNDDPTAIGHAQAEALAWQIGSLRKRIETAEAMSDVEEAEHLRKKLVHCEAMLESYRLASANLRDRSVRPK